MGVPTVTEIQAYGAVVAVLVETGKLVASEITSFVQAVARRNNPDMTPEEMDAAVRDVLGRAEVREALSRAEAGQSPVAPPAEG